MKEPQSNLEEKVKPNILKDYFASRTDPPIFTSIEPLLLDRTKKPLSFTCTEINKSLLTPVHSVS